ncbi:hypothetical protein MMC31_001797 [Peltigera leucophlebia]|nr:hypothetical protein [Peltigera leucophlebia]
MGSLQLAHILEYRNNELLIKNSEELHMSSESAREIATAAKAEQEAVALVLAKVQKDSSLVKILTFTLFTSNLIQLPSPEKALMIGKLNGSYADLGGGIGQIAGITRGCPQGSP